MHDSGAIAYDEGGRRGSGRGRGMCCGMKTIARVASGSEESWVVVCPLQPVGVTQREEVCDFNFRFGTQPWGLLLRAVIHQSLILT